jgi:hypothetical protein
MASGRAVAPRFFVSPERTPRWLPWENKSKKKLPQAGQEPVEAVESERSGPDTGHDTRFAEPGKDIMQKICHNFAERLWE